MEWGGAFEAFGAERSFSQWCEWENGSSSSYISAPPLPKPDDATQCARWPHSFVANAADSARPFWPGELYHVRLVVGVNLASVPRWSLEALSFVPPLVSFDPLSLLGHYQLTPCPDWSFGITTAVIIALLTSCLWSCTASPKSAVLHPPASFKLHIWLSSNRV